MKRRAAAILLGILMLTGVSTLHAEPERLPIKDPGKQAKERAARAQIKNIDLRNVEDPAARKAIQEILNYLGLQARN